MSWRNRSTSQYFAWISESSQYDLVTEQGKGEKDVNADVISSCIMKKISKNVRSRMSPL